MARRRNRLQVKVEDHVALAVTETLGAMRGPPIDHALHEGVDMITVAAAQGAPRDSGQLAAGVYTASFLINHYRPLVRLRNGQRLNSPLKFPPRRGQALSVSSVFYTRFVEGGVKGAAGPSRTARSRFRGLGYQKRRPFFQSAKRRFRQKAVDHVQARLVKIIEGAWQQ
jgi:hypothetical protein